MSPRAPRELVGAATAAIVLVIVAAVAQPDAGVSGLVVLICELLLAGGAAYLLDDAAVALTTVTPVGVWRRGLPRLLAAAALISATWALVLVVLLWQDSQPPVWLVSGELAVLCVLAIAAAAVLAARGESEPGGMVAPAVGLLGIGALIADLFLEAAIFVPWDGSGGAGVPLAWASLGGLAVLVIAEASRDPARSGPLRATTARLRSASSPLEGAHGQPAQQHAGVITQPSATTDAARTACPSREESPTVPDEVAG